MAEEVIYADIKAVRTVGHPRLLQRSVSSNSSTAQKLCPSMDWKLHGGKCYWVAENKKSWNESIKDCAMKNSHLIVIEDSIDMEDWKEIPHEVMKNFRYFLFTIKAKNVEMQKDMFPVVINKSVLEISELDNISQ
ncbi:putative C-type lectin-like domain family 1 [Erinaceus europaeus]|uniref:C-type lectin-like domain family 1 n=1 Tax=Erinaceus europaeus TaxID=9365 RepID=A0ABM3XKX5_ERIEU|nr:putative C-type lectin-like domain family 1 [Erinaceus europaeus]